MVLPVSWRQPSQFVNTIINNFANTIVVNVQNYPIGWPNTSMNDLEFKQQVLDPVSASFCAAKWYNATIWLGSGQTTSCHHPPAHLIDADKVNNNSRLLHNTDQKKEDRAKMLTGERPAGCEYCWKIEDMGRASELLFDLIDTELRRQRRQSSYIASSR